MEENVSNRQDIDRNKMVLFLCESMYVLSFATAFSHTVLQSRFVEFMLH